MSRKSYNEVPSETITSFASELVRIPSQAGIDPIEPILQRVADWLSTNGLKPIWLFDDRRDPVGVYVWHSSERPGPTICLNACLDTAPFGDEARWTLPPNSGAIENGKLWGRGAADSKAGAAILCHAARELVITNSLTAGNLYLLFDGDEHTGRFGGINAFLQTVKQLPDSAVLGYPGNEGLTTGARGFLRVRVRVSGLAAHSGAAKKRGVNAIQKIAQLVAALGRKSLPPEPEGVFFFGPSVTVTQIDGGYGYSQVPDTAACGVDIRLTINFDRDRASAWLNEVVGSVDASFPSPKQTTIDVIGQWPAYVVDSHHPLVKAFSDAGRRMFGRDIPNFVCGPSNIGNLLTANGIPTICGLGVSYENLHATDEFADLSTIPQVFRTYCAAVSAYLSQSTTGNSRTPRRPRPRLRPRRARP